MNQANVSQLKDILIRAPVRFQGVKFDEQHAVAETFARWLIESFAVILPDALSDTDCVEIEKDVCGHVHSPTDDLDIQAAGSLLRGVLKNIAKT